MNTTPQKGYVEISAAELEARKAEEKKKLGVIGLKVKRTDRLLVHLLARRTHLAMQVAKAKHPAGSSTVRVDIEDGRLAEIGEWAEQEGLNPNFAKSLLYNIIGESCKVQGQFRDPLIPFQKEDYSLEQLRKNLLVLTEKWAPKYDEKYAPEGSIKRMHLDFEHQVLSEAILGIPEEKRNLFVDIGCATGRETFLHADKFKKLIGYDVSPHMIERAKQNLSLAEALTQGKIEFCTHDIEQGIPLPDKSVSCVYIGEGTASDIPNIGKVLLEIRRVLQPGGVFFLSFYNTNALAYKTYLPWPPVLGAEIGEEHCLEVECGGTLLPVFARGYSPDEAEAMLPQHLVHSKLFTHPTVSSITPRDVFEANAPALDAIRSIESKLVMGDLGTYIVLTGIKTCN